MRHLSLEGKKIIFKSLAWSKIVYLALHTIVPVLVLSKNWMKFRKSFYGQIKKCKIKHGTLCNDYKNGGLKNVDLNFKTVSLKCSWICRLHNKCHLDGKIIPLNYI